MKTADEIRGLEYDWIALDAEGRVALFSTAGAGFAPSAFLEATDAYDGALAAILEGPATTVPRLAPDLASSMENTWRLAAERGLFAFDCDPNGGPYRIVAAPMIPRLVGAMPPSVAAVISRIHLRWIRFDAVSTLTERELRGTK